MKIRFVLNVMYGDADGFDTFSYITEDMDEVNFLRCFIENFTQDLAYFYNRPDLLKYNKTFKNNEVELTDIINNLTSLSNVIQTKKGHQEYSLLDKDEVDENKIYRALDRIINFIEDNFSWYMRDSVSLCLCFPKESEIKDITGFTEITRKDAITIFKEKLNMDVVFID